jgi:SAM-dependent methyltransferase
MSEDAYGQAFYDLADRSIAAARVIAPRVMEALPITSVLDVGCARGAWLAAWREAGCADILGVDGAAAASGALHIPRDRFVAADLAAPLTLGRRFDLVQCLEVAEHLPPERGPSLVADLTAHAEAVLFSAAPPGQGGAHHINERPYDDWRRLFASRGFVAVDWLRSGLATMKAVPYWYRYNLLLYVAAAKLAGLSDDVRARVVPEGTPIADLSPPLFRLRKAILGVLPAAVVTRLAQLAGT